MLSQSRRSSAQGDIREKLIKDIQGGSGGAQASAEGLWNVRYRGEGWRYQPFLRLLRVLRALQPSDALMR